jgi:hypothetical protein
MYRWVTFTKRLLLGISGSHKDKVSVIKILLVRDLKIQISETEVAMIPELAVEPESAKLLHPKAAIGRMQFYKNILKNGLSVFADYS